MIHIKFDSSFCDEFLEYNIIDEEIYDGPNSLLIHFSVYTYQGRCETHVIVPNGPSAWKIREENYDVKNGLIKIPTYGKKKHI